MYLSNSTLLNVFMPAEANMYIPQGLLVIIIILILGSWFLLGEKKSFLEKLSMLIAALFVYVAYRIMTGSTMDEIIAPFMH